MKAAQHHANLHHESKLNQTDRVIADTHQRTRNRETTGSRNGATLQVYQSGTAGTYSYKVVFAHGSDSTFKGGTGTLVITQTPTFTVPYYTYLQSTIMFS